MFCPIADQAVVEIVVHTGWAIRESVACRIPLFAASQSHEKSAGI